MRNFPLHEDKIEEIGISMADMEQYAAIMGEALAAMQWIGEVMAVMLNSFLHPPRARCSKKLTLSRMP
jgi:hypothetical protein